MSSDDAAVDEVAGQMSLDDAGTPAPDPGNAEPDQWSTDLDETTRDRTYAQVNTIAVGLAEPDLNGDSTTAADGA